MDRSEHDDGHDEGELHERPPDDHHRRMDQLGILRLSNKYDNSFIICYHMCSLHNLNK